jgi:hypothetical protein
MNVRIATTNGRFGKKRSKPRDSVFGTVIGAPNPIYKDHFGASEEVWMAVNPNTIPAAMTTPMLKGTGQ